MKAVSRSDALFEHYPWVSVFPDATFVLWGKILRFEEKPLARWVCDNIDLNKMAMAYQSGAFTLREYMQFYQDIGYSLSGFEEVFGKAITKMEKRGVTMRDLKPKHRWK